MKSKRKNQTIVTPAINTNNLKANELEPKINSCLTKCDLCLEPLNTNKNSPSLLNEIFLRKVFKIIGIKCNSNEGKCITNIYSCDRCKARLNSVLIVFAELQKIRNVFNNLKEIVAKQVMLGPLAKSESDFDEWKSMSYISEQKQHEIHCRCTARVFEQNRTLAERTNSNKKDIKLTEVKSFLKYQ